MATLGASPMRLDLRLPLTDAAASAASAACERALDAWLGWMRSAADAGRALPAGAKQTQVRRTYRTKDLHQTYEGTSDFLLDFHRTLSVCCLICYIL